MIKADSSAVEGQLKFICIIDRKKIVGFFSAKNKN